MAGKKKDPKIEAAMKGYRDRINFLWTTWFKLRKCNMTSTGDPDLDLEIKKECGAWWFQMEPVTRNNGVVPEEGDFVVAKGGCHKEILGKVVRIIRRDLEKRLVFGRWMETVGPEQKKQNRYCILMLGALEIVK